jgi:hypothetical protein
VAATSCPPLPARGVDVRAEHLELGVGDLVLGRHRADLRDQTLDSGVLDLGLVEQVALDLGFARHGEKNSSSIVACAVSMVQIGSASARRSSASTSSPASLSFLELRTSA